MLQDFGAGGAARSPRVVDLQRLSGLQRLVVDSGQYLDRFRLDGRTALITGASRNIGAAIARAFAAAGAKLVVNARDGDALAALASAVREHYAAEVIAIAADLGQPDARARMIGEIEQRVGGIDILVNNAAGGGRPDSGLATSPELWRSAIEVNLTHRSSSAALSCPACARAAAVR